MRMLKISKMLVFGSVVLAAGSLAQTRPDINEQFPIRSGKDLSPPIVLPVGECARSVHVTGYIPHAIIRVFAHVTELIGTENPYFAETDVRLTRTLNAGESITATQEVLSQVSSQSVVPMIVGTYPATLNTPAVQVPVYECGRVVPANNLNPGTHLEVFQQGLAPAIGQGDATQAWQPVVTSSLAQRSNVFVRQTACPGLVGHEKHADSPAVPVQNNPSPVPLPVVETPPVGADAVTLHGLLTGSAIEVSESGGVLGAGFSTGDRNYVPVTHVGTARVTATQKLCTGSGPSAPVTPSTSLSQPIILTPVCEGTHFVTVRGAYVNSILVLFRNGAIAGMAGGTLGDVTMTLGGRDAWTIGDEIRVLQYVGPIVSSISAPVYANCNPQNVITQHNDNSRSGATLKETHLTPAFVASPSFVKLYTRQVDGDIVGQPLFVKSVRTSTGALKDLFIITTSKNNIYAFDANDLNTAVTTPAIWPPRNLCSSSKSGVCQETYSQVVGITSTPVIDPGTQTMYVVANCTPAGTPITPNENNGRIRIYAINIGDGTDRVPSVEITGTDPGSPSVHFDPHCQRNRPGLLLSKGVVYAAFATFSCDQCPRSGAYHGWVIGYRASDLSQTSVYCTSPRGSQVGIWQTGNGLVGSPDGSIFFETGNGPATEPLQNSFVKISPTTAPGGLATAGHFTPNNARVAIPRSPLIPGNRSLADGDTDLGSGGPLLLPQGKLIGGGKQGRYYVMDTSTMQLTQNATPDSLGYDGFQAFTNTYHKDHSSHLACPVAGGANGCDTTGGVTHDNQCYVDPIRYGDGEKCGPNIHGGPIFWQTGGDFGFIYLMPEKDYLKGFRYDFGTRKVNTDSHTILTATGAFARPPTDGMPGGYSSLSANGRTGGIVWTSMPIGDAQWRSTQGKLVAFDALTLRQIWADSDNYAFAKAVPPTIADGKVIRATGSIPPNAGDDMRIVAVYGDRTLHMTPQTGRAGATADTCYSIIDKYSTYGGALSILGTPVSDEMPTGDGRGRVQRFRGSIFGITSMNTSIMEEPNSPTPTCSVPKGKTTVVESAIYSTQQTCANIVQGEILQYWEKLGGTKSQLGYPTSDETFTPDHMGRLSTFEHGTIVWYPGKGAYIQGTPPTRPAAKPASSKNGASQRK